ncbi:hypothetical protein CRG98_043094 [Punica granatum]|uniref:CCHC-type domain-containing protein n=1 Tax=Punica granatum TaxID=22663 RepID=A0A2I0HXT5_PUNGR|nr:hypothetical protein CRG98_043094 [Punica granatum]
MLRTAEQDTSKRMPVLMIQGTKKKGKGKSKGKKAKGASKCDSGALKPKANVAKDDYCFYCGNIGHWKRNCKVYLEELRKKNGSKTSISDTRCGAHICGNMQDLRDSRSLAKGEADL